jgi:hypothetical protein
LGNHPRRHWLHQAFSTLSYWDFWKGSFQNAVYPQLEGKHPSSCTLLQVEKSPQTLSPCPQGYTRVTQSPQGSASDISLPPPYSSHSENFQGWTQVNFRYVLQMHLQGSISNILTSKDALIDLLESLTWSKIFSYAYNWLNLADYY